MEKSFFKLDPVTHEGATNTWFTPKKIIDALGDFDLDPCTQTSRPFDTAKVHYCEDYGMNGLKLHWFGRVWLNPPYGKRTKFWLDKLARHGDGIALVFARTETTWAQDILNRATAVNFLAGRLCFIKEDGTVSTNAGTGSMLIAFGARNADDIKRLPGLWCIPRTGK
jgi:hypothetical protein